MSRTSALGCVPRTVLIRGSSTGLAPPPRGAPSRASRRRTAAVPAAAALVSPAGAARAGRTPPRARLGRALPRVRPDAGARAGPAPAGPALAGGLSADETAAGSPAGGPAAGSPACDTAPGDGGGPGAAAASAGATPPSAGGSSGPVWSCCPASAWVTSVPAVPAVATSPATCAPHVRRSAHSIGGRFMTCPAPCGPSHRQQRADLKPGQAGAAVKEAELQQDSDAGDLGAAPADQAGGRGRGPAGGQHVVDDQDP